MRVMGNVQVVDAITGCSLDVKKQTVNINVSKVAGKQCAGYRDAPNMHGLAANLCSEAKARSAGEFDSQPVLIRAGAGTGKTWGTQQVRHRPMHVCAWTWLMVLCVCVCVRGEGGVIKPQERVC